jgi:predicted ArsR family transcriptional regulator
MEPNEEQIAQAAIPLERDGFLRDLLRELSGTLQDVIGLDEASGFINVVGQRVGERIDSMYRVSLGGGKLSREQVPLVLVDLKRRIQGDFFVIEQDERKIVLGNRRCPFGDRVKGRPALCMMTSNVFGVIAAENLGYARVAITEAIAQGHAGCRVEIHLQPEAAPEPDGYACREYFSSAV